MCQTWAALINDSQNNFSSSPASNDGVWNCSVDNSDPTNLSYGCEARFSNLQDTNNAAQALVSLFKGCFPNIALSNPKVDVLSDGHQFVNIHSDDFPNGAYIDFGQSLTPTSDGTYGLHWDIYPN
jgi:hypothetical protein